MPQAHVATLNQIDFLVRNLLYLEVFRTSISAKLNVLRLRRIAYFYFGGGVFVR